MLEELQDKHPVTASLQFPHLLLTLKLAEVGQEVSQTLLNSK